MAVQSFKLWTKDRSDWCNYEVEDAQWHVPSIRASLPTSWEGHGVEINGEFELLPERQGDPSTWGIAVRFDGRTIGHIPDDDIPRWVGVVSRVVASGLVPTTAGRIYVWETGRWAELEADGRPSKELGVKVQIKLGEPSEALPVNDPPTDAHTLLPRMSFVKVTKTEEHTRQLLPFVPPTGGTGTLIATLHQLTLTSGKAPKTIVEVRVDGIRVGQLTPQTGQRFLPMIKHLEDRGLVTACRASITGSAVAAELHVDAVKAHEAGDDVLDGPPITIPALKPSIASDRFLDIRSLPEYLSVGPPFLPPARVMGARRYIEPTDAGAVVRFQVGRTGYYTYLAMRSGDRWLTTADNAYDNEPTPGSTSVREVEDWNSLCNKGTQFQVATAWEDINPRDPRMKYHRSVIRLQLGGATVIALTINPHVDTDYPSWYYTLTTESRDRVDDVIYEQMEHQPQYWQHGTGHQIAVRWKNLVAADILER